MKHLSVAALVALALISGAVSAATEYKLTRLQYTASDGVRYDSARRNLYIVGSQAIVKGSTFKMKSEIVVGNYLNGDRDVYEQYKFTSNGNSLRLVDPSGRVSHATVLRVSPLRIKFDTGVIANFRQVSYTGRDRNPGINSIQTVSEAIEDVVTNEVELGPIGF